LTCSGEPVKTTSLGFHLLSLAAAALPAVCLVRPSTMLLKRVFSMFSSILRGSSMPSAPGYSAILNPSTPCARAVIRPNVAKPELAITTLGMPIFSASAAGRTAAGVQFPHAPLPEISASQPSSLARAATCLASSFCAAGSSAPWI